MPPGVTSPVRFQQTRAAVLQSWIGVFFTAVFGALYAAAGSPWSGGAIGLITLGLLATPSAIRQGASVQRIANGVIGLTWTATLIVSARSGGVASPALVWTFLLPLSVFAVCGRTSAYAWAALAGLQIAGFYAADLLAIPFPQDFTPRVLGILRLSGYAGVIVTIVVIVSVADAARHAVFAAQQADARSSDRARILDDMHDGVGSQLLGVVTQLRAGTIQSGDVIPALESCLDDLRLIVTSLDQPELDFEVALADLRCRMHPRCAAAGIELVWRASHDPGVVVEPAATLHVLRGLQEMLTNALRHSTTARLEVTTAVVASTPPSVEVGVRDFGVGFDLAHPPRRGRGLKSLRARARKLGGELESIPRSPGTELRIRFALPVSRPGEARGP